MKKIENTFTVTGFVGKDAEIRSFTSASVARFSLAVGRQEKSGDQTSRVSAFLNFEAWRKNENKGSFDYLAKGTLLTVEGYFKPERWTDKDGIEHNSITMVAVKFYPAAERRKPLRSRQRNRNGAKITSCFPVKSGLRVAFLMLIVILLEPVPFILYPCRSRRPLIFLCKVKPGGNRQGAATFVVNNHQLAGSSILLEHKCNRHGLSASSLPCSLLSGLYPAHKIKSRRKRRNL